MDTDTPVEAIDVPIVRLVPLRQRKVSAKDYAKLLANIRTVGLIEPLCVYREGDSFLILDGFLRYQALLELGVQTVPCLVLKTKDTYTANRQVNHLTRKQQGKLLRQAIAETSEETVANAFGDESLKARLRTGIEKELHPEILKAMEEEHITRAAAYQLTFVAHRRQLEVLELMREGKDSSAAFIRAQVLRTPANMRAKKRRGGNPWEKSGAKRRGLVTKLQEVEKHHDFYSALYRQYVGDLLKLAVYVRQVLTRPKLRAHLERQHPDMLQLFETVVAESEGKAEVG